MTKGKRRKLLNMIAEKLRSKPFFSTVQTMIPVVPLPTAGFQTQAFVFRLPETIELLTNEESRGLLRFCVLGFVKGGDDIELLKADCQDEIEAALLEFFDDSTFLNLAVQIKIGPADPGPTALIDIGLQPGVSPPFGVIRVEGEIEFDYLA